jgi:glutamyl-tRNA reductase
LRRLLLQSGAVHDLALIGASYRTVSLDALGRMLLPRETAAARLPTLARELGVRELLYVGTCNRLEILARVPAGESLDALRPRVFAALTGREPDGREAQRTFRVWSGAGAVEHLLLVACGLDSAQVGDREIATQLRDAWLLARKAGVCGARLDQLVAAALLAAREVRELDGADPVARKGLAARAAAHVLSAPGEQRAPVALVGVSAMTRSCGRVLAGAGVPLIIVNRSLESAVQLAAELHAESMSMQAFRESPPAVRAVVTAVGTAEPVLGTDEVAALARCAPGPEPLLIVDLGVPANVSEEALATARGRYIGMDQLVSEAAAGRPQRLLERTDVRAIVDRHLDRAMRASARRLAGPLLGALHESYVRTVESDLEDLLQGNLARLDDSERAALRRWGSLIARRMAHVPLDGLRRLASEGDLASVEACIEGMTRALGERRST